MRKIDTLVFHTAATPGNKDSSAEALRRYHVEHLGWSDIGYHWVIRQDGLLEAGRPEWRDEGGIKGPEPHVLNVCCTGHGDEADFTDAQKATLARLAADKVLQHPGLTVARCIGHREAEEFGFQRQYKTCPGTKVDCDELRLKIQVELDARQLPDTEPAPPPVDLQTIQDEFDRLIKQTVELRDFVRGEITRR